MLMSIVFWGILLALIFVTVSVMIINKICDKTRKTRVLELALGGKKLMSSYDPRVGDCCVTCVHCARKIDNEYYACTPRMQAFRQPFCCLAFRQITETEIAERRKVLNTPIYTGI